MKWPHSGWTQLMISLSGAVCAAVIAFPVTKRYLVWYYSHDPNAVHDGQTGMSVLAGGFEAALVAFFGILMLTLFVQQIKTGQFSKKQ